MKRVFLICVFLLVIKLVFCQEFVFLIYFEDAAGFKDTITVGYDINATSLIDENLGEVNIISQPLNEELDVRITDEWISRNWGSVEPSFHTKTQIVKNSCGFAYSELPVIMFDIKSNNWPVTISWDNSLFEDDCFDFCHIASFPYWEMWDVLRPNDFQINFRNEDEVIATDEESTYSNNTYYVDENNDTVRVYFIGLDDEQIALGIDNINKNQFDYDFYNDENFLHLETNDHSKIKIEIYDMTGKLVVVGVSKKIDISILTRGLYVCKLTNEGNLVKTLKFIK